MWGGFPSHAPLPAWQLARMALRDTMPKHGAWAILPMAIVIVGACYA